MELGLLSNSEKYGDLGFVRHSLTFSKERETSPAGPLSISHQIFSAHIAAPKISWELGASLRLDRNSGHAVMFRGAIVAPRISWELSSFVWTEILVNALLSCCDITGR
jgi:hypothetical protein